MKPVRDPCRIAAAVHSQVGRVTRSADVFSFAVVMYEALTWQIPYDEYNVFQVRYQQCTARACTKMAVQHTALPAQAVAPLPAPPCIAVLRSGGRTGEFAC